jgi:hypothetical protein
MDKDIKVGDQVITVKSLWHHGQDIGDRLARVINTTSYIVIDIYEYTDNPVKCFRNEVTKVNNQKYTNNQDIDHLLDDLFG